jgi:hypothetical protein
MAEITASVDVQAGGVSLLVSGSSWLDVARSAAAIALVLRDAEAAETQKPVEPSGLGCVERQLAEIAALLRRIERSVAPASALSLRPNSDQIRPGN